jgi:hypothetical protein
MTLEAVQRFAWDTFFLVTPRKRTLAERERDRIAVERLIGPSSGLGLPPTAQREAAGIARVRLQDDGPPDDAMIDDAARYALALDLKPEGNHWRGRCVMCDLPDSLTLTARLQRVECCCDSGVCDPFTLEAVVDGRLTQLNVEGFRQWSWKAAAIASRRAAS